MRLEVGKINKFGGLFLSIVLILYVGILLEHETKKENEILTTLLDGEQSKSLIRGKIKDIRNGRIEIEGSQLDSFEKNRALRTGWYQTKHRVNPIANLPGVNIDTLTETINALEKVIKGIPQHTKNHQEQDLADSFHPFEFLNRLSRLEYLRREMLFDPTHINIARYHFTLQKTLESYTQDTTSYLSTLTHLPDLTLSFLYQQSDKEQFKKAVELLQQNIEVLLEEEDRRFKCYRGIISSCRPITYENLPQKRSEEVSDKKNFSPEILTFLTTPNHPFSPTLSYHNASVIVGSEKIIFLESARCVPSRPAPFLYVELKNQEAAITASRTETLSELVFFETKKPSPLSIGSSRYLDELTRRGSSLYYQSLNLYFCPDSGYDETRILSTIGIYNLVEKEPLGKKVGGTEGILINEIEKNILNEKYLFDTNVQNYITTLNSLLSEKKFRRTLLNEERGSLLEEIENRINLWKSQSSSYEKIVANALLLNSSLPFFTGNFKTPLSNFFITRSYPSIFFLPFNTTLIKEGPSFSRNSIPIWERKPTHQTIRRFTKDYQGKIDVEDLVKIVNQQETTSLKLREEYAKNSMKTLDIFTLFQNVLKWLSLKI